MSIEMKIATVIVTYNRLELLKECIGSIRKQTYNVNEIIVINNSSSDGTLEWLTEQNDLTTITQENLGGAGGFYTGIKYAYENGYEWIWCMDDDVVCNWNALERLIECGTNKSFAKIGFIYPRVVWKDNSIHKMNEPGYFHNRNYWNPIAIEKLKCGITNIDTASFTGVLFSWGAIKEAGLPDIRLFIYFDDLEYTSRMRNFLNIYVADSIVLHKTERNVGNDLVEPLLRVNKKNFFNIRNFFFFYSRKNKLYAAYYFIRSSWILIIKFGFNKYYFAFIKLFITAIICGVFGILNNQKFK